MGSSHYMVTLASLADGKETTFWISGKSERVVAIKAKKLMGVPSNVVESTPCNGSPLGSASKPLVRG